MIRKLFNDLTFIQISNSVARNYLLYPLDFFWQFKLTNLNCHPQNHPIFSFFPTVCYCHECSRNDKQQRVRVYATLLSATMDSSVSFTRRLHLAAPLKRYMPFWYDKFEDIKGAISKQP